MASIVKKAFASLGDGGGEILHLIQFWIGVKGGGGGNNPFGSQISNFVGKYFDWPILIV